MPDLLVELSTHYAGAVFRSVLRYGSRDGVRGTKGLPDDEQAAAI